MLPLLLLTQFYAVIVRPEQQAENRQRIGSTGRRTLLRQYGQLPSPHASHEKDDIKAHFEEFK
jgi:hypothetical protein